MARRYCGRKLDYGTVYELMPSGSGWTEGVLYSFAGNDGAHPYSGVIFDESRNLYGTTRREVRAVAARFTN